MKKLNPKVKAGCGVAFVFGIGFAAGLVAMLALIISLVQKADNWRTQESKAFITKHIANQLELDKGQSEKFRPIMDEFLEERWDMRRDYLLNDHLLVEEVYFPRIAEFLTEAQKKKGLQLMKNWRYDNATKLRRPSGDPAESAENDSVPANSD